MKELTDYSGEFIPKVELQAFSKDMLAELVKVYSRLYMSLDGFWYLSVMNEVNEDTATACDFWVWSKQIKSEVNRITKLLNIQGNDIQAFMKYMQFSPWFWNLQYEMDIKGNNFGSLTVTGCHTLEALEKEGKGRDKTFCQAVEVKMFDMWAEVFNPDIKVTYSKLPPRQNKDDICCVWEFRI